MTVNYGKLQSLQSDLECVLIINCYLQKEMNYRNTQIQSYLDNKFIKYGEQITTQQNRSEKYESLQDFNTKTTQWTSHQKLCFVMYWMQRFLENPLEVCSFHTPLTRKSHFQEVSDFIRNQLGQQFYKTPQQCKTRFSAIKRKVIRQRKSHRKSENYDFCDYILDQGKSLCRNDVQAEEKAYLLQMIQKLESMRREDGDFMSVQKKIRVFQHGWEVELKNNQIYKYLMDAKAVLPILF